MSGKNNSNNLENSGKPRKHNQISEFFSKFHNEHSSDLQNEIKHETKKLKQDTDSSVLPIQQSESCNPKESVASTSSLPQNKSNTTIRNASSSSQSVIAKFFDCNPLNASDSDFETPMKKPKVTAKAKRETKLQNRNCKIKKKGKLAFTANEQNLTKIFVEQSMAENINPDDLQMALAMSRSEAEMQGTFTEEKGNKRFEGTDNIKIVRSMLNEFGFKSGRSGKDYDFSLYMPSNRKGKWANKFTPLTLRDVNKQIQKVNHKIETFLMDQYDLELKAEADESIIEYQIYSGALEKLKPNHQIFKRDCLSNSLEEFYVLELFSPSRTKVGYLMKDVRNIPGRDLSPMNVRASPTNENDLTKETEPLIINIPSPSEETPNAIDENKISPEARFNSPTIITSINDYRPASPDLFVDYESSFITSKKKNNEEMEEAEIQLYEKYTSDEVKNYDEFRETVNHKEVLDEKSELIDLTLDDSITEETEGHTSENFYENCKKEISNEANNPDDMMNLCDNCSESDKFQSSESENESCICISDDEINYSTIMANKSIVSSDLHCSMEEIAVEKSNSAQPGENKDFSIVDMLQSCTQTSTPWSDEESNDSVNFVSCSFKADENINSVGEGSREASINFQEAFTESFNLGINLADKTLLTGKQRESVDSIPICLENSSLKSFGDSSLYPGKTKLNRTVSANAILKSHCSFDKQSSFGELSNLDEVTQSRCNSAIKRKKIIDEENLKSNFYFSQPCTNKKDSFNIDEIDKLVYGSQETTDVTRLPENIRSSFSQNENSKRSEGVDTEEFVFNNDVYLIRRNVSPKPNYHEMDSSELLKELRRYGLKSLKRKQALIMLEYIYNQTHPYIVDSVENESNNENLTNGAVASKPQIGKCIQEKKLSESYNLNDCFGDKLLEENGLTFEMACEEYFLPTNTRKKIQLAPLPLHIAWFNLIKSNPKLYEAILFYKPVNLQEIYLFFKGMGYRYEPKDMKKFFDNRCITFQYDVGDAKNGGGNTRQKRLFSKKLYK